MLNNCILFNILCTILISTNAHQLLTYEPRENKIVCGSDIFAKRTKTHTIVLDTLEDNWNLNNCLSSLTVHDDRIIFSSDHVPDKTTKTKLAYFTYNTPNIVVYVKSLSNIIFENIVATLLFKSHWSLLNIVLVDNATFVCKNGDFSKEVYASIYEYLNRLWHKYQMMYVIVSYPTDCPNKYSMYDGNKQTNLKQGLYDRTIKTVDSDNVYEILKKSDNNLTQGFPLKANIFYRVPTSITDCDNMRSFISYNKNLTRGYCGTDALIMHDVLQVYKFNVSFEMENINYYGYIQSGQVTGTLGLVVSGEIDVSFNSRFMVSYALENQFEFLFEIWSDYLCAFMKEPNEVPLWHYPFNVYDPATWACTTICLIFVGAMMYVKSRLFRVQKLDLYVYVVNAVWCGLFGFFFNKRIKRSLLAAICLLCSMVLTAKYQSNVNYMFATLVRYDRYRTLTQLYNNGIQVYTSLSVAVLLTPGIFPNNAKSYLVNHLKFFSENVSAPDYALNHPNVATIERMDKLVQIMTNETSDNGRPLLYTVNECLEHYYLSFIVRSGFPFTNHLNVLMMKIVESGLPSAYNKWTSYTFKVTEPGIKPTSEPRPTIKISIYEQRVAFIVLLLGYLLSLAIFFVELWLHTRTKRAMDNFVVQTYLD